MKKVIIFIFLSIFSVNFSMEAPKKIMPKNINFFGNSINIIKKFKKPYCKAEILFIYLVSNEDKNQISYYYLYKNNNKFYGLYNIPKKTILLSMTEIKAEELFNYFSKLRPIIEITNSNNFDTLLDFMLLKISNEQRKILVEDKPILKIPKSAWPSHKSNDFSENSVNISETYSESDFEDSDSISESTSNKIDYESRNGNENGCCVIM